MISLDRVNGRNMPGLCYVDVVPVEDVLTMPATLGNSIATPVVLLPGKQWYRIQVAPPGCLFNEQWSASKGQPVADSSITAWAGRDEVAKLTALWSLPTTRFLALCVGLNGDAVLMGTKAEGCRAIAQERRRGNESNTQNGYQLTFSVRRSEPAPFYLPPVPGGQNVAGQCATLPQLLQGTLLPDLLAALPPTLYNQLSVYFSGSGCPTLAQLLSLTTPEDLYPLLTTDQAVYAAQMVIDEVDGGDSTTNYGDEVDDGGTPPPPPGEDFDAADFEPTEFFTA